jgi:AcrR family transcriptional regulator
MIIDAALPLLLAHGEAVTTQQIASAAGIAEGTVFRVFASKDDLIEAVLAKVLDPDAINRAIGAIPTGTGLETAVVEVVRLVQRRVADIWQLMSAVGPRFHNHQRRPTFAIPTLVELLGAHRAELAVDPDQAALILRSTTLALTHPMMTPEPFPPETIARHFLHGVVTSRC